MAILRILDRLAGASEAELSPASVACAPVTSSNLADVEAATLGGRSHGVSCCCRRSFGWEAGIALEERTIIFRQSVRGHGTSVSFRVGDLLALPAERYQGILCRGVLNDFVSEDTRLSVFAEFARALRPAGVLILDVREWEATKDRKQREHHRTRSRAPTASSVRNAHAGQRRWRTFERLSVRDAVLDEKRARVCFRARQLSDWQR